MYLSFILGTFFLTFYGLKLWLYTPAYKNRMAYCQHNIHDFPQSYNSYNWLGLMMKDDGRRYEALGCWFDGLKIRPDDFRLLFNTAQLLGELGYLDRSFMFFEKVKKSLIPDMMEDKLTRVVESKQVSLYKAMKEQGAKYVKFVNNLTLKERDAGHTTVETTLSRSTNSSSKGQTGQGKGSSTKKGK